MSIKIIYLNNWGESTTDLLNRYSKQTPKCKGIWKNLIGVTNIKDADFYIVLEGYHIVLPSDKTIYIKREPDFIRKHTSSYKHQINLKDTNCGLVWWINKTYDELKTMQYPQKTKNISCIVSSKHKDRLHLTKQIIKYNPDIDLYGRGHSTSDFGTSYKGEINNDGKCKIKGLLDYKYSIVMENSQQQNYFTEKIADAYLSWCMPIYWGCPNINQYFNHNSYTLLNKQNIKPLNTPDIDIEVLTKARNLILDEYNIWEIIYKKIQNNIYSEENEAKKK